MKKLKVNFQTKTGKVTGVNDLSFSIFPGETVCLVGESGSGKSVSSLAIMRLVEFGGGKIDAGTIMFASNSYVQSDLIDSDKYMNRYKLFLILCSELFKYNNGTEWYVVNYLFSKRLTET